MERSTIFHGKIHYKITINGHFSIAILTSPEGASFYERPPYGSTVRQACDRLTRPREVAASLRLAEQRAQKAQEKTTRKWRLLQVLLEVGRNLWLRGGERT